MLEKKSRFIFLLTLNFSTSTRLLRVLGSNFLKGFYCVQINVKTTVHPQTISSVYGVMRFRDCRFLL